MTAPEEKLVKQTRDFIRKLRDPATADAERETTRKLVAKRIADHPGLIEAVIDAEVQDVSVDVQERLKDWRAWGDLDIAKLRPPEGAELSWAERTFWNVLDWAQRELGDANQPRGGAMGRRKKKDEAEEKEESKGRGLAGDDLVDALHEEADCDEAYVDVDEDCVCINVTIPFDLWEDLHDDPAALVEYIDDVCEEEDDE